MATIFPQLQRHSNDHIYRVPSKKASQYISLATRRRAIRPAAAECNVAGSRKRLEAEHTRWRRCSLTLLACAQHVLMPRARLSHRGQPRQSRACLPRAVAAIWLMHCNHTAMSTRSRAEASSGRRGYELERMSQRSRSPKSRSASHVPRRCPSPSPPPPQSSI